MGNVIELRHITAEEAEAYVRQPARLVQAERTRREEFSKRWHVGFNYDQWNQEHKQRSYKWKLLFGLVAVSEEAVGLLAHGGQPVGGLEESWQLEAGAKTLPADQVAQLYHSLAAAPVAPAKELFEIEAARLFQDLLTFLREAVETGKALLLLDAP